MNIKSTVLLLALVFVFSDAAVPSVRVGPSGTNHLIKAPDTVAGDGVAVGGPVSTVTNARAGSRDTLGRFGFAESIQSRNLPPETSRLAVGSPGETTTDSVIGMNNRASVDCIPVALTMCGESAKEESLSLTLDDLSPKRHPGGMDATKAMEEYLRDVLSEGSLEFDWCFRRANGRNSFRWRYN